MISIHGRSLINKSTMNILKAHRLARRVSKDELLLEETAPLLNIWRSWSSARPCNDEFGVVHGYVETVHSFTNDQNLIDNFHKGDRRRRSAALNMVITETGAAKAVAKALPELLGKLTGSSNEEDQQQTLENIRRTYKAGDTDLACRDTRDVQLSRPGRSVAELTQPGQPAQRISLPRRSLKDCLAEELRRLDPDEIFGEALLLN
ncbi:hypothetical protein J2X01_004264 [Arthrobacter ginsengisoli]|uniref:DUF222 domain-containing protein n=1 Tax=Arthrobacter ginsengisoli TaxID=1356565 RepID=A0ABU1UIC6_9MICC|nr:hypothetical protein [Arthrobacter ginsengisoli]